jgi:hypothetical protein
MLKYDKFKITLQTWSNRENYFEHNRDMLHFLTLVHFLFIQPPYKSFCRHFFNGVDKHPFEFESLKNLCCLLRALLWPLVLSDFLSILTLVHLSIHCLKHDWVGSLYSRLMFLRMLPTNFNQMHKPFLKGIT